MPVTVKIRYVNIFYILKFSFADVISSSYRHFMFLLAFCNDVGRGNSYKIFVIKADLFIESRGVLPSIDLSYRKLFVTR